MEDHHWPLEKSRSLRLRSRPTVRCKPPPPCGAGGRGPALRRRWAAAISLWRRRGVNRNYTWWYMWCHQQKHRKPTKLKWIAGIPWDILQGDAPVCWLSWFIGMHNPYVLRSTEIEIYWKWIDIGCLLAKLFDLSNLIHQASKPTYT